jgi:hypothetical protein
MIVYIIYSLDETEQISDILDDPDAIGQATSKDGSLPGMMMMIILT